MMRNFIRSIFKYKDGGIHYRTMLVLVFWVSVLTLLALLRVNVLFEIRDLEIEARQLQDRARLLAEKKEILQMDVHRIKDGSRLLALARDELKMTAMPLTEIETLTVSRQFTERYDLAKVSPARSSGHGADPGRRGLSILLSVLSSLDRE